MSASGGKSPYTGTGTFTVPAGTYTYTVTDANGTTQTTTITVTQPSAVNLSVTYGSISVNGGTTTLTATASGGSGSFTYKINNGAYQASGVFAGVAAGTHTVTVKDSKGCTATKTVTVTQPAGSGTLRIMLVSSTGISCKGKRDGRITVSASGGTSPYLFKTPWVPYSSDNYFTNLMPGTYKVTVKDATGATASIDVVVANSSLSCTSTSGRSSVSSLGEANDALRVSAYPNPSTNYFNVEVNSPVSEEIWIEAIDINGKYVYRGRGAANRKFMLGETWAGGTYIIRVIQGSTVLTQKVIKLN